MGERVQGDPDLKRLHLARHPNDLRHKALQKFLLSGFGIWNGRQRATRVGVSAGLTANRRSGPVREHGETRCGAS